MYNDLMCRQKQCDEARLTIYGTLSEEDEQYLCAGLFRDSVIITNLGVGKAIDEQLKSVHAKHWLEAGTILGLYYGRGADELPNRALKTYGHEQLPFRRFDANTAWYYLMLLGSNLIEVTCPRKTKSLGCGKCCE
jgi:hypothetical protein